ncbi:MAG: GNAT family N-acetyltransferase, partial [Senegalia sp. (in: firmicutes)]
VNSNDIDKLSNFEKEARITEPEIWVNEFNEDEYKDNLNKIDIDNLENSKVIVAIQNGIIIGRSDISISLSLVDFEKTGYIDWIYVLKNKRGLGIGKKLFAGAEKYFKQKGVKEYYLFTAQNDQAQQFYHRQSELTFSKKEVAEKEIK